MIALLDGQNLIYVWVGAGANRLEKDAAENTAKVVHAELR